MAEAIAVVGVLSSVLQLFEFTTKIALGAHKLVSSGQHATPENGEITKLATEYEKLGKTSLDQVQASNQTPEEQTIFRLGSECQSVSQALLDQMKKLSLDPNIKGSRRILEGTRKAAGAITKRKEIERNKAHLQALNGQLATAILQLLFAKQYGPPGSDALMAAGGTAGSNVEKVLVLAEKQSFVRERTSEIIESLSFPEQNFRRDAIDEAYRKTYHWALQDENLLLKAWLKGGDGIFWITGKAGSGKSTLLKFLCEQAESRKLLQQWCGEQDLKIASFFFWYAGTPLQKSVPGLLRSILFQILTGDPNLTQIAFPGYFTEDISLESVSWTYESLVQSLKALAWHQNTDASRKKFCFFIDGLDEYDGNHLELIGLLNDLARNADIKLCVSSRAWNAFRNAFNLRPSIRLEELSRLDMWKFANGRLESMLLQCHTSKSRPNDVEMQALVEDIVDKAEGVFLWVALVVKSIERGLTEGDMVSMLRQRVREFPADLEDFFRVMLSRIDRVYRSHTNQALKLACLYVNSPNVATFVDFWLIRQHPGGLATPRFPYEYHIETVSSSKWYDMILETRTMLSAACKDLLMLPYVESREDAATIQVQFLHRTVYDFLQTKDISRSINQDIPTHFGDSRILHLLNLVRLKFKNSDCTERKTLSWLNKTLEMSIQEQHPDLNEEYVSEFESIMIDYSESYAVYRHDSIWRSYSHLFVTLVAFQCKDYFLGYFEDWYKSGLARHGLVHFPHHALLIALFGEDVRNKFGLDRVNLELLRKFQMLDLLTFEKLDESRESCTIWQLFLGKWYARVGQGQRSSAIKLAKRHDFRHIWELAKIMLDSGAPLSERFRAIPTVAEDFFREPTTFLIASNFLKTHVPLLWRQECDRTRDLDDITGDEERCDGPDENDHDDNDDPDDNNDDERLVFKSRNRGWVNLTTLTKEWARD